MEAQVCPLSLVQVPVLVAPLHFEPAAQLEVEQQTPSTQLPLVHSLVVEHELPLAFLVTHAPLEHQYEAAQSASPAQAVLQAVAPHTKGLQATVGWLQVPTPLHVPTRVSVPVAQLAAPQLVLAVG